MWLQRVSLQTGPIKKSVWLLSKQEVSCTPLAVHCEYGNEHSGCVKCGKFLNQLSDCCYTLHPSTAEKFNPGGVPCLAVVSFMKMREIDWGSQEVADLRAQGHVTDLEDTVKTDTQLAGNTLQNTSTLIWSKISAVHLFFVYLRMLCQPHRIFKSKW